MSGNDTPVRDRDAVFAGRIDILYALGRHYLSLPFAALCIPATMFAGTAPGWLPFMPLMLQIAVVIAAEQLTTAYKNRNGQGTPLYWARRYAFVSAVAGATWGVGVLFWFVPDSFPAQAYLVLAFLGMTATEFIARSAHRPAYLAHAVFSLGPLVVVLALAGGLYQFMTAVLVTFFGAVLFTYCNGMARLLDESIFLRLENVELVTRLKREKKDAEAARDAAQASGRVKTSFIANISHELRTPLNALLGMAQLLDRAELEKPHRDHVKVMLEAGRGLQMLLDDVIALSRDDDVQPGEDASDPATGGARRGPAAAAAGVGEAAAAVGDGAREPALRRRQRARVRQALLKLVDNALKFTERGGIEVRIEAEGGCRALLRHRYRIGRAGRCRAQAVPALHAGGHILCAAATGHGSRPRRREAYRRRGARPGRRRERAGRRLELLVHDSAFGMAAHRGAEIAPADHAPAPAHQSFPGVHARSGNRRIRGWRA